mgnify:FL=1|jgi:hypothetical protein
MNLVPLLMHHFHKLHKKISKNYNKGSQSIRLDCERSLYEHNLNIFIPLGEG